MKKFLFGLIVGAVLFVPVSTFADYVVKDTPWTNVIYRTSGSGGDVSVFDDGQNKCYVVKLRFSGYSGGDGGAISCVKDGN